MGKYSGLMNRLSKVEFKNTDPVKLKWLMEPSEKKIKKWEKKGYTVVALTIHKEPEPTEGEQNDQDEQL